MKWRSQKICYSSLLHQPNTDTSGVRLTKEKQECLKNLVSDSQNSSFHQNDLDFDPMTLVLKLDLDMVRMYHHTKR